MISEGIQMNLCVNEELNMGLKDFKDNRPGDDNAKHVLGKSESYCESESCQSKRKFSTTTVHPEEEDSCQRKKLKMCTPSEKDQMFEIFQPWALKTYGDLAKTKTITLKKKFRILKALEGKEANNPDSSKFRFWVKSKGFTTKLPDCFADAKFARMVGCVTKDYCDVDLFVASTSKDFGERTFRKVAAVERFFQIIYNVHVELGGRNGRHAGQKRTYRIITETYAFLPREAVTKFLSICPDCQKNLRSISPLGNESSTELEAINFSSHTESSIESTQLVVKSHKEEIIEPPLTAKKVDEQFESRAFEPIRQLPPFSYSNNLLQHYQFLRKAAEHSIAMKSNCMPENVRQSPSVMIDLTAESSEELEALQTDLVETRTNLQSFESKYDTETQSCVSENDTKNRFKESSLIELFSTENDQSEIQTSLVENNKPHSQSLFENSQIAEYFEENTHTHLADSILSKTRTYGDNYDPYKPQFDDKNYAQSNTKCLKLSKTQPDQFAPYTQPNSAKSFLSNTQTYQSKTQSFSPSQTQTNQIESVQNDQTSAINLSQISPSNANQVNQALEALEKDTEDEIDLTQVKPITSTYLQLTRSMGLSDTDALQFNGLEPLPTPAPTVEPLPEPNPDDPYAGLMKDADKLKLMLLAWNYQNSTAVRNGTDGPDLGVVGGLWAQYQNALTMSGGKPETSISPVPRTEQSSPMETQDETNSSGQKDEDEGSEDDSDDKMDHNAHDPERLKAFNMFVRLFVDENLDRMIPISKQPKEKIQAIIDSCSRQFPEFSERSRKRIRTYLKSCRRNKKTREGWDNTSRPTPAHLTSVQAEQILGVACENESMNAKRMRVGLDPISQSLPLAGSSNSAMDTVAPSTTYPGYRSTPNPSATDADGGGGGIVAAASTANSISSARSSPLALNTTINSETKIQPAVSNSSIMASVQNTSPALYRPTDFTSPSSTSPFSARPSVYPSYFPPALPTGNVTPTDLSMKPSSQLPTQSITSSSSGLSPATCPAPPLVTHKLSANEITAARQVINAYRESAAFLLRTADQVEQLLIQQQ